MNPLDDSGVDALYEALHSLVAARRSIRRFLPDPVPRDVIERVLDVARLSPSAANSQPWEFVVVTEAETRRRIARASASVFPQARKKDPSFEWNISVQPFLHQAPVLVIVLGDKRMLAAYPSVLRGNVLLRQSLAICTYGLQLAAASLGLGSAWGTLQGGAGETEIRELLHIPDGYTVDHIVPLGYADKSEGNRATALRAARERGPQRRPLKDIVHWEGFEADKARSDEQVEEFIWAETVTRVERR
ncbi:MAG: nitroreductase family protein [Chloroflexota bacterium]